MTVIETIRKALIDAKTTSRDGTVVHASMNDVVCALIAALSDQTGGWQEVCDDLGCAHDRESFLIAIDNLKQRASGFDGGLLAAATRMRDMLTSDGDPPTVIVPEDIDANAFTQAFDNLATAMRAVSK